LRILFNVLSIPSKSLFSTNIRNSSNSFEYFFSISGEVTSFISSYIFIALVQFSNKTFCHNLHKLNTNELSNIDILFISSVQFIKFNLFNIIYFIPWKIFYYNFLYISLFFIYIHNIKIYFSQ